MANMNQLKTTPFNNKKQESRICLEESVIFKNGINTHIIDIFPYTKTLFFHNCDKNFIYHNLKTNKFPNLQKFYCISHPCDPSVMHRFADKPDYTGHLISCYYHQYLNRWWYPTTRHVKEITDKNYDQLLNSFVEVEPSFE